MDENDLEGTALLEKLAEIGQIDAFYDAVDADDFRKAAQIMRDAGINERTYQAILKQMAEQSGDH